jgi:uncharacterized caspase-like protein
VPWSPVCWAVERLLMARWLLAILLAVTLWGAAAVAPSGAQPATSERGALRVLAIGIGAYRHIPRLHFAGADARALAAALEAQAGEGRLYDTASVTILVDGDATLPAIRGALAAFTSGVRPGETLILFLSGHGVREGERFYFAAVDLNPENMAGTGLPWQEVLARLQEARRAARAVWVLADCCRAAPELARDRQATGRDLRRDAEEGGNLLICTGSSDDTPSYESEDLRHGLFTQAWLEALHGEAPEALYRETPRGRVLTLAGLQRIVDMRVLAHAREAGVRQRVEFPRLEGRLSLSEPLFMPVPRRRGGS